MATPVQTPEETQVSSETAISPGDVQQSSRLFELVRRRQIEKLVLYTISVVVTLGAWQYLADNFLVASLFPTPLTTLRTGIELFRDPQTPLMADIAVTLARLIAGFIIGSSVGVILGMLMGAFSFFRNLFMPYVQFFRFVPALAWLGPAIMWFGATEQTRIMLVVYTTAFVVTLNTMAGVISVPRNQIRMARSFGAGGFQVFWMILVPGAMSYALTGMRLAMGNSFMTVVTAEMLGADQGLGFILHAGRMFFRINSVFVAIVLLGLLGFLTDRVFVLAMDKLAWKYQPANR